MTRVATRGPPQHQTVAIKQSTNTANLCLFLSIIAASTFIAITYFIVKKPTDSLGDPSDQFTVKQIPKFYTKLEGIDPEERDVFQGFRTSFLPPEEIVLAHRDSKAKREIYEGNVTSDILIWGSSDDRRGTPTRVKRMSHFTFTSQDYDEENRSRRKPKDEGGEDNDDIEDSDTEVDEEYDSSDNSDQYDEDEGLERMAHPEPHVDRGPLDDVVEQVRAQPELEEGEMGSSAHLFKPARAYTGIHAFWKDQGDRETIRNTQANIMKQYMDAEADPCHDFYQYACGNWAALNPIPADKAGYDTFEMLRENLDTVLRELLEFKKDEHVTSVYPGSHLNIEDNFFTNVNFLLQDQFKYSDEENKSEIVNRIRRYLNRKSKELIKPISKMKSHMNKYFFLNPYENNRVKRSNNKIFKQAKKKRNIVRRKFIIKSKPITIGRKLQVYTKHVKKRIKKDAQEEVIKWPLIPDTNVDPANGDAALKARFLFKSCMNYEILQKREHQPLLDLLEILGGWPILNPNWNATNFDWLGLMANLRLYNNDILISEWVGPDIKNSDEFVIQFDQTSLGLPTREYFLQHSNKIYLEAYKKYLITVALLLGGDPQHVNTSAEELIQFEIKFYFILFGREQSPPRWKNCISQVNSNMGMALGSMFVRKYFDETSKNDTLTMTREIQQSFRELLHMTTWIDDETKKLAAHKVDAMMLRIGYPDFILDKKELNDRYKEVKIHPDKYFENILNILQHLTKMEQSRIGQPVNKTLWNTAPAVVNAYYSRNKNQIMFPAGILQPPFYHRHFPRSLNYGGIGVVIGHEITHGFDDKGRLFDCDGNLHRWWSDSAIEAFHRRAQCLIDQYGHYVVPEVNMKLDGVNTQGENIADNGGVKQAFRAYLHWLQRHGSSGETLPGLNHTHTQLFFLNFAQVWCGAMRPEAMRNKLKTAVHSPGRFRVIGTLSNSHDFAREFRCPPGSPMNPKHKCSVW